MNQDELTEYPKIEAAEQAVARSVERIEHAMENLAVRLEESSHRIKHTIALAQRSARELVHIKDSVIEAAEPLKPYFTRAYDGSRRAVVTVRSNPRPFLWTLAGLVGGYLVWRYTQRHEPPSYRPGTLAIT